MTSSQGTQRSLRVAVIAALAITVASCTGGNSVAVDGSSTTVSAPVVSTTEAAPVEPEVTTEPTLASTTTTEAVPELIDRPLANPVTVLAVSDLTDCRGPDAEVAELVRSLEGTIVMPGDLANREGSRQQFEQCFVPQYGTELDRLYATPGDNDYNTPGAAPYFETLVNQPGDPGKGWYAIEIGSWQLISLNSNCDRSAAVAKAPSSTSGSMRSSRRRNTSAAS